jgi:protein-S-isoprenylcysteine O-methyltransferase Ste14
MIGKHIALTLASATAFGLVMWKLRPITWTPLQTIGLCLFAVGFVLWTVARFQLGASFAVTAQARQLVTHGIYSKIRNPIYVFGSFIIAGIFLLIGHPRWLLMIFVVVVPMQIWRARKESAVLEAKFGDEYRTYRASTWF